MMRDDLGEDLDADARAEVARHHSAAYQAEVAAARERANARLQATRDAQRPRRAEIDAELQRIASDEEANARAFIPAALALCRLLESSFGLHRRRVFLENELGSLDRAVGDRDKPATVRGAVLGPVKRSIVAAADRAGLRDVLRSLDEII